MKFTQRDVSAIHSTRNSRTFAPLQMSAENVENFRDLAQVGIGFDASYLAELVNVLRMAAAMDNNDVGITPAPGNIQTTASIPTLVQFLQTWLPGFVNFVSAARKIDTLVPLQTIGSWEDEQAVQGMLEPTGNAVPYGDYNNVPLTSWNVNFEWRTVVRFEMGILVSLLEEARAARIRVNSSGEKRAQAAQALEIQRNRVGFYGFNDGSGRTYGFLNDPSLPAYRTVTTKAAGGTAWSGATFNEITADIRIALAQLQVQSMDRIDVEKTAITMALPMGTNQYLTVTQSVGGISVRDWIRQNYPNIRVETAPELVDGNGGSSAMYIYAESIDDGSSDDGKTMVQLVQSKFMALGVEKRAKSYVEDYANAMSGVLVKRPTLITRWTGV
jgi:hypothetical protein